MVSLEVPDLTEPELRQEILKLRRRIEKLAALLRLALALTRLRVQTLRRTAIVQAHAACPGARIDAVLPSSMARTRPDKFRISVKKAPTSVWQSPCALSRGQKLTVTPRRAARGGRTVTALPNLGP